jgi:hypothetical protein
LPNEKEIKVANKLVYFLPCCCWAMTCDIGNSPRVSIFSPAQERQHRFPERLKRKRRDQTHALDNLGLLDEEGTDDALANAVGAARATVRALDRLDALRDLRVLARAKGRDLCRTRTMMAAMARVRGYVSIHDSFVGAQSKGSACTYTRERDVAVTALGGSRGLLDRKVAELATCTHARITLVSGMPCTLTASR